MNLSHTSQATPGVPAENLQAASPRLLLAGLLAGPIVWTLHELLSLILIGSACSHGHGEFASFSLLGTSGWSVALHLVSLISIALVGVAELIAVRSWRRSGLGLQLTGSVGGPVGRSGWMAMSGVLISTVFLIAIVLEGLPVFWLSGCR